jgi:hypothetical protein
MMLRMCIGLLAPAAMCLAGTVYSNDFQQPAGTAYPEWTGGDYSYTANQAGTVTAGNGRQAVTNTDSPNGQQRFLGEFGGPTILSERPYDPQHFVRVDQTVRLTLAKLAAHKTMTISFDLYVLKSWDGNNPNYGPDRWKLGVQGGPALIDATFSNNPKTAAYDLSLQNYPADDSPPCRGAAAVNTLGYKFFGDSTYHLTFTFVHTADAVVFEFASSLFEGKGAADESWGLDNVVVSTDGFRAP